MAARKLEGRHRAKHIVELCRQGENSNSEKKSDKSELANFFEHFSAETTRNPEQSSSTMQEKETLFFETNNATTLSFDGDIITSQSTIVVEFVQETAPETTESNALYESNNNEIYLVVNNNNSYSSAEGCLVSHETEVQHPIQPDLINDVENENDQSNNSNDSNSILISSQRPQNLFNLESELQIYDDTTDNDREWIPEIDDKPTTDTDVTDASDSPNLRPNNNLENGKTKRKRKRIADPSNWNDIVNKRKRERGEAYTGWSKHKGEKAKRGAKRFERKLEPACTSDHCQKTRDCQKIIEPEREFLFNYFWKKMSWDQKKVYVASRVSSQTPKRRTTGDGNNSRRKSSFAYSLKTTDNKVFKVCKKMFLSTLGLNEWMVINWIKDSKAGMSESTNERNIVRQKDQTSANRKDLKDFIDQLPKLPSHYCRKSTSKIYLEPTFRNSMSEIFNEYVKKCATFDPPQKPLSRFTFDMVIKEKNIGFQPPKKDRCDLCISYETGNVEEEIYQHHLTKKEKAREEKNKDKSAANEGSCDVLTMDLQAVKICPSLNASALYYKTKLCVHNFTVYNINSHHCRCYWFDETEADLTANTFASCLIDYLSNIISDRPVIIWSDGCTYQNRNATLSNALLSLSVDKGITIYQKYLTKGHTQMEADSVHATIERKIKNKSIHLPSDYTRFTSEARRNPQPYEVKSLDFSFCHNYGVDMVYPSIRPGKSAGDPQVTDITAIKYSPDGTIKVKTSFDEEFQDLPKKRGKRPAVKPIQSFPQLHTRRIPIKKQKWLHLQQLKDVIPRDCHIFYDNLPHE